MYALSNARRHKKKGKVNAFVQPPTIDLHEKIDMKTPKEKHYCLLSNLCKKNICCHNCDSKSCKERCLDDKSKCKYADSLPPRQFTPPKVTTVFTLKKWDKNISK